MFISKSEKEDLQKKVENLSVLLNQALNRAQKSEEKISELSSKLSGLEEMQVQQQLKIIGVMKEFEEIDGLSEKIIERITNCDSRAEGLEKFFASRYRHYDDMDKELKSLSSASKKATENFASIEKKFENFVDSQAIFNAKAKEQIKILASGQQMKNERVFAVERLLDTTRGVLFGLKKDMAANKKDFNDLCKIAVTRDEPAFALDGGQESPEKATRKPRKSGSTKDTTPVELVTTPEAPYGLKKDGTPKKRPGRKTS